jgi:hypothetical protein
MHENSLLDQCALAYVISLDINLRRIYGCTDYRLSAEEFRISLKPFELPVLILGRERGEGLILAILALDACQRLVRFLLLISLFLGLELVFVLLKLILGPFLPEVPV